MSAETTWTIACSALLKLSLRCFAWFCAGSPLPPAAHEVLSEVGLIAGDLQCASLVTMTTLEDIEKAVAELPHEQLVRFRAWFEQFEAARFDERIERDDKAGRLDQLAEQALADFRAGRAREL
jgi:hypothetical protein